jgi:membrane peptidoglycan carboxypeptidase
MQGRATNLANVLSLLGAFVATAMVMGLLAAGLMIPAVGATGSAAKSGVEMFDSLPSEFSSLPLSQQSRILDAKGNVITTPQDENRILVKLKDVAPIMQKAQIAIEDSRFYEHGGADLRGIARAAVSNFQGGDTQGASTLTQQFVKITLQENALRNNDEGAAKAAVAQTYTRKLQELKYAVSLEQQLTKDQILEGYLNLVYYGDLAYGVEAAAQHYFSVPAKKLNLGQSALLAGLVQNPSKTDPVHFPEKAQVRRDIVLDRMLSLGMVSAKDVAAAKKVPVKKMLKITHPKSTCARSTQPYFCNYVMAYLKQMPELGKSEPERVKNINQGGLTIQTTLNPNMQKMTYEQIIKKVPVGNSEGIGSAASIVEPGTGKVLAMVQNSKYTTGKGNKAKGETQVNWNVDTRYGGTTGFQFGSTAKMYAIVTALQNGIPVNGKIPSKFATTKQPAVYTPSEMRGRCKSGTNWEVRNDESIGGRPIEFKTATAKSVNTAFASLVLKLGIDKVNKTMGLMGLHQGNGQPIECYAAPVTLGASDATPLTLAASYATLAANGKYCAPNPILSITTNDKKPIKLNPKNCKQVIDPDVAKGATALLKNVITNGTGRAADLGKRPAAGKTGTTDNHVESWFIGYTTQLSTAVWVGTPYSQKRMQNLNLAGQFYNEVFGGTISAPLWQDIMERASKGMPIRDFADPSDKIREGDYVDVPNVSGMSVDEASKKLEDAGFSAQVVGRTYSTLSEGTVVHAEPSGRALRGATIGLYTSLGYVPAPPKPKATPKATPKPSPSKTTATPKPKPTTTKKP